VNPLLGQHADRLLDAGVAGNFTSHGAENNLNKIRLLLELDEANTFGMEDLLRGVGFEEAYEAVAHQLGNPPDREENEGRELGGDVRTVETRGRYERGVSLDWADSVAALGDGASLFHTHDPEPMRDVLQQTGAVELVVADHGFAGAAIAAGIPTVVVMDTNDPAFAVVAGRGADVKVVPMDDNRPLNAYATALDVVRRDA
jgi:hypothetical protein